jgi:hypothetical protein
VGAAVGIPRLRQASEIGAGYLAKAACSCVYLAGRELEACRADLPTYFSSMEAALLPDGGGVRARTALFDIERVARYGPGRGCRLEAADGAGRAGF